MKWPNPVRVFWVDETAWATGSVHGWARGNECVVPGDDRVLCCSTKTHWIDHGLKPWPEPKLDDESIWARLDPRCERCGRVIDSPNWYANSHTLYRLPEVKTWTEAFAPGTMVPMQVFPPGAMWDAHWLAGDHGEDLGYTGRDGISLCVKLPNGHHWQVDSEASNCDRKQRVECEPVTRGPVTSTTRFVRSHYCWVRRGNPRLGELHVGKEGDTCSAGGGSIWVDRDGPNDWHGFCHGNLLKIC